MHSIHTVLFHDWGMLLHHPQILFFRQNSVSFRVTSLNYAHKEVPLPKLIATEWIPIWVRPTSNDHSAIDTVMRAVPNHAQPVPRQVWSQSRLGFLPCGMRTLDNLAWLNRRTQWVHGWRYPQPFPKQDKDIHRVWTCVYIIQINKIQIKK